MNNNSEKPTLNTAATRYLASLPQGGRETSQPEIFRFVRWFSREKTVSSLTAAEVADYAEHLSLSTADYAKRIEVIKSLLLHMRKGGWLQENLALCLKPRKLRAQLQPSAKRQAVKSVTLTRQGYEDMKVELEKLKEKRLQVIEDIRRAASDKDLSENAPYHAAREEKSRLDGRIMELEETLKIASIVRDRTGMSSKASIGDTVILKDLESSEELCYTLVNSREVNPGEGRISLSSPIGRAIAGHGKGDVVEVTVPAGKKLRYQIEHLGR